VLIEQFNNYFKVIAAMILGIIIVFRKGNNLIYKEKYIKLFNKAPGIKFCLVNNNIDDCDLEVLLEIQQYCLNVTLVNIKKDKSDSIAIRAGARYLSSLINLRYIGYIAGLKESKISETINDLVNNQNQIIIKIANKNNTHKVKQTFSQSLFSVTESLIEMDVVA
jgi:hypothetical protein